MEFEIKPLDIVCFHVGGCGGYGPIDAILYSPFKEHVVVVVFEARDDADDLRIQQQYGDQGVRTLLVPRCVSDEIGKTTFYINNAVASSGIFQAAEKAKTQHVLYTSPPATTWSDVTQVESTMELETTTLDEVCRQPEIPNADVLSIDAQGAEYRILKGGTGMINSVTCVVTEIEFFEIYAGQSLFCDQFCFLHDRGFRLADLFNQQFWYPAPAAGKGFLSVGEALFLREVDALLSPATPLDSDTRLYKLIKLAAISYCFQRYSHVYAIIDAVLTQFGQQATTLLESDSSYLRLLQLYRFMHQNLDRYYQDNFFFMHHQAELVNDAPPVSEPVADVAPVTQNLADNQQEYTNLLAAHTHLQQQTQQEIQALRETIAAMETSKFWQLRNWWVRLKHQFKGS